MTPTPIPIALRAYTQRRTLAAGAETPPGLVVADRPASAGRRLVGLGNVPVSDTRRHPDRQYAIAVRK